jgi:two-component system, NarL family, invasion response regulator UvrY
MRSSNPAAIPKVRVLVVDDHDVVRRSICSLLSRESSLDVVCETATGEDAVIKAQEQQPDLILLDIGLPGISGVEAARQIRRLSPLSKILFLSQYDFLHMATAALKVGCHGYVTKIDAGAELLKAIESVLNGSRFVSQRIRDQGWTGFDPLNTTLA